MASELGLRPFDGGERAAAVGHYPVVRRHALRGQERPPEVGQGVGHRFRYPAEAATDRSPPPNFPQQQQGKEEEGEGVGSLARRQGRGVGPGFEQRRRHAPPGEVFREHGVPAGAGFGSAV